MSAPAVNGDGVIADPLTDAEYADLETLETTISKGLETFVEVGNALAEIRDRRLDRQYHESFDAYCREQWEIGRSRAYQLIHAAEVVAEVSTVVDAPVPSNEAQARELGKIDGAEAKAEVMAEASEDGPPTAPKIKDAVTRRTETPAKGAEVRTETIETEPLPPAPPKRSKREQDTADAADRQAQNFCQYRPSQIDERTVVRLELWCQKWRDEQ